MIVWRGMLKYISLICLQVIWVLMGNPVFAKATDSTSIKIMVEHKPRLMLRGSVVDNSIKKIVLSDIKKKKRIHLGSFSLHSRENSNCDIGFKTKNNFKLKLLNKPNTYLAKYKIAYNGKVLNGEERLQTGCNFSAKDLMLVSFDMLSPMKASEKYQDTITIFVTVP